MVRYNRDQLGRFAMGDNVYITTGRNAGVRGQVDGLFGDMAFGEIKATDIAIRGDDGRGYSAPEHRLAHAEGGSQGINLKAEQSLARRRERAAQKRADHQRTVQSELKDAATKRAASGKSSDASSTADARKAAKAERARRRRAAAKGA